MSINITQQITVGGGDGADVYNQARSGAADGAQDLIQQLQSAMNRKETELCLMPTPPFRVTPGTLFQSG